jgi:hypothetical protein
MFILGAECKMVLFFTIVTIDGGYPTAVLNIPSISSNIR